MYLNKKITLILSSVNDPICKNAKEFLRTNENGWKTLGNSLEGVQADSI